MEAVDRLPFWPKLNGSYPRAQTGRFAEMSIGAIHDWVGSDKHEWVAACVQETRTRTSVEVFTKGDTRRTVYRSPGGETEMVMKFDAPSQSWHPVVFPVRTREDIELMTDHFEDVEVAVDSKALQTVRSRMEGDGDDAVFCSTIGKSPLMHWVEFLAGVEQAHFLLHDCTEEVERLLEAMHQVMLRKTELMVEQHPADAFYLMENTSTTLISPDQYRRYCDRHIREYGAVTRQAGRLLILHMCGLLKDILGDLRTVPAEAFEAFTSPTLGNTTLLDGRSACPDKCLIGGTNAVLWTQPAEEIIAEVESDLDALPHHRGVAVTSAGVMPPLCEPGTIRAVCQWLRDYPVRM